jgi:glycine/D-amino acid oxidase-like deaminating enzyme
MRASQNDPLTRHQSLRRDQPLWLATPRTAVRARKNPTSDHFDVVIVGAGISGALMAHALCGKGLKIMVIDRRDPVRGSSAASTAMIQHEIDVPLHRLTRSIGRDKASRVWKRSARAVEDLKNLNRDLDLRCAFQPRRALFLSGSQYGERTLEAEVKARESAGIDAEFLDAATLLDRHGIGRRAAIDSAISASANPVQMTAAILRAAQKQGVEIVSGKEITDLRETGDLVFLATGQGKLIASRHVVFCTGYEFLECLKSRRQRLVSTWALASRPRLKRPKWLDKYLVWEGSDPYLYFRSTADGRVIVGGEDEEGDNAYASPAKARQKADTLRQKLLELTGIDLGTPEFAWSAAFGITPNGLPMIGPAPGMQNVFVSMGFGGNGITFSQIAADLISAQILGHQDPDWDLFPVT